MRRTILNALLLSAFCIPVMHFSANAAETYVLDPTHTTVVWKANHFGFSNPHGLISMVEGTLTLDETNPANSAVEATINTQNIFTGNGKFDDHLKSKDFFNIGEFPKATFKSTKVEPTGEKTAKVTGNLTLLGKTNPVILDVTFNTKGEHPFTKKPTVGFTALATIKRSDFGMNFAVPNVADEIPLVIEAEANGQ